MARASSYEVRQRRKEKLLTTLSKLDDRDTQAAAASELVELVRMLDSEGLSMLVSCLCSIGDKQKVFSRKECVRLLGLLASDKHCAVAKEAIQQPHIGKVITAIRSRFKDSDSTVRDAAAESIGSIAGGLALHSERTLDHDHPLVKGLMDSLKESNLKEVQAAACDALRKAIPHLEITPPLAKAIVKLLHSKTFMATAPLLATIAGLNQSGESDGGEANVGDCDQIDGMVKYVPSLVIAHTPTIIGNTATPGQPATGIISHLQSKEWITRRAACEAVYVMAAVLGPRMDGAACVPLRSGDMERASARALQALSALKFDRVEPVRKRATSAIAVLTELQEFLDANLPYDSWSWSTDREIVREREVRKSKPDAVVSTKERFVKKPSMEGDVDVIVKEPRSRPQTAPPAKVVRAGEEGGPPRSQPSRHADVSQSVDGRLPGSSPDKGRVSPLRNDPQSRSNLRPQSAKPSDAEPFVPEVIIKAKPRPVVAPAPAPSSEPDRTPGSQQQQNNHPVPQQAGRQSPANGNQECASPARKLPLQGAVPTSPPHQGRNTAEGMMVVPAADWASLMERVTQLEAAQSRVQIMEEQQSRMLGMVENFALNTQNAFVAVEARVTALEMMVDDLARMSANGTSADTTRDASFFNATFAPEIPPGGGAEAQAGEDTAELGALYNDALREFKLGRRDGLEELLLRTGPQWNSLSEATALQVLRAMEQLAKDDPVRTLPALLPWLWQLADEDIVKLSVPGSLATSIVATLRAVPTDAASLVGGNLPILVSTFEWLWGLSQPSPQRASVKTANTPQHKPPVSPGAATQPRAPAPIRTPPAQPQAEAQAGTPRSLHRRRASREGIDAMQAQLNAMQAELVNSPRVRGW